jgi:hypothetical protein
MMHGCAFVRRQGAEVDGGAGVGAWLYERPETAR